MFIYTNAFLMKIKRNRFKIAATAIVSAVLLSSCIQTKKEVTTTTTEVPQEDLTAGSNHTDRQQRPEGPPSFNELLKDLDANNDGRLAIPEIKGRLKDHASEIDTNKDGFITEQEMKLAPKPERGSQRFNVF